MSGQAWHDEQKAEYDEQKATGNHDLMYNRHPRPDRGSKI